jgi:hypothetical protein
LFLFSFIARDRFAAIAPVTFRLDHRVWLVCSLSVTSFAEICIRDEAKKSRRDRTPHGGWFQNTPAHSSTGLPASRAGLPFISFSDFNVADFSDDLLMLGRRAAGRNA